MKVEGKLKYYNQDLLNISSESQFEETLKIIKIPRSHLLSFHQFPSHTKQWLLKQVQAMDSLHRTTPAYLKFQ